MMRFILFVIFMFILTRLGLWALGQLRLSVDPTSFVFGVLVTIVSGAAVFRLSDWYSTATRPGRPQTVTLETKDTPAQITRAALGAILLIFLIFVILGFAAYAAFFIME